MKWTAIYVYLHSIPLQEKLIKEISIDLNNTQKPWFFIKYWYGGPHIRIRYTEEKESFKRKLEEKIRNFIKDNPGNSLDKTMFYENNSLDGEELDRENLPWYEHGTYFYEKYEPEVNRYGEGRLLELSELIFYKSSQFATKIFETDASLGKRTLIASLIMYETLKMNNALDEYFLDLYRKYWAGIAGEYQLIDVTKLREYIKIIIKGGIKIKEVDDYIESITPYWDEIKKLKESEIVRYITSSQIHMMNNRLSVTPSIEYGIGDTMYKIITEKKVGKTI